MAIPSVASKLVPFATTFRDVLTASPGSYFIDPADLMELTNVTNSFLSAQLTVANPEARSGMLIEARDTAQDNYYEVARPLYTTIQANPDISNEDKAAAGVKVKDTTPTPTPVPSTAPTLTVESITGNMAKVRLADPANPARRARPPYVQGANVFTFAGENAPTDPSQWKLVGAVTRTVFEVVFDASIEPGSKVWLTACWFNSRSQVGPASNPVFTYTQLGGTTVEFGELKMAA